MTDRPEQDLVSYEDPRPYQEQRVTPAEEGPARSRKGAKASLPPGSRIKPDLGSLGDVDRAMPYEGDPSPDRMQPQPFSSHEPS